MQNTPAALLRSIVHPDGTPDVDATLVQVPALLDAGVTTIAVLPRFLCRGPDEYEAFLDKLLLLKRGDAGP